VIIKKAGTEGDYEAKLVKIGKPVCRIPSLCIHLQSGEERAAFAPNKEDKMQPILSQFVEEALTGDKRKADSSDTATADDLTDWHKGHEPELLTLLAKQLNCEVSDIVDFELSLYDVQPATLFGVNDEFLSSARLDNQITCITGVSALINYASNAELLDGDADVSVICLFDHEEVGSASAIGAGSPILSEVVRRIPSSMNTESLLENEDFHQCTIRRSFVLSVDMAHA
jgi:aspartyl aminopeptidase